MRHKILLLIIKVEPQDFLFDYISSRGISKCGVWEKLKIELGPKMCNMFVHLSELIQNEIECKNIINVITLNLLISNDFHNFTVSSAVS